MRCRPLSLEQGLKLAGLIQDQPAAELATEEAMMRLRLAINATGAEVSGYETFEAIPDKAAAMTLSLLTRPPFNSERGRLAYGLMTDFLRRNDWHWTAPPAATILRFDQEARAARTSHDLWTWLQARMSPLNDAPVGRPTGSRRRPRRRRGQQQLVDRDQLETVVMAYLAGPVAALPSSDHDCIRALGASIDGALSEGVRNLDLPWTIKVVHPSWELHPDRRSVSDRELWEHNRNVLLGQADALIITDVGLTAAGFGAACELDLHCLQDGPVLYLRDQACGTHSRYLEGRRREIDLTVRTYQDVREIPGLAERWIKERANAIETARLRRSDRRRQYEPLRKRLVASWGELDDHQRKFVAGTARLKPVLINDALGSTESLYTLPSHKLDSLCAALDVDRVHTRPREGEDQATMPPNYEALLAVALDEGWPSGELRMLFEQSQDEHSDLLRTGAALRQRRNTQADWKARRREL